MTALRKDFAAPQTHAPETAIQMELGSGVELFTTGLARGGSEMLLGDGVEMFTTGLQRRETALTQGAGTDLFTTGLAPKGA